MKITALILAGGKGERFWPRSRTSQPKQFLSLTEDGKTMIQLTVERILPLVALEDIYIVTNLEYSSIVCNQLPTLPPENILCEPVGRNTAPCIGLGAMYLSLKYEEAIMLVLPADHMIRYQSIFLSTLREACETAQKGENLVTIGITPNYPETGYGYIKFHPEQTLDHAYVVERFVEKPNVELAKEYISTNEYLWNSGMFIWKLSTILNNMQKYMPDTYAGLIRIRDNLHTPEENEILEKEFRKFASESIDCGILEKAEHIYILPGSFGWDDVGSWLAVERIRKSNELGNVVSGNIITIDTKNCIIEGTRKLIATVGMEDTIVVDTEDATLICNKNSTGDIKKVLENLKICNRNEYI